MDILSQTHKVTKLFGLILAGFIALTLCVTSPSIVHAQDHNSHTSWMELKENFSHMSTYKKLAILIAANARAENRHTIAVRDVYNKASKVNKMREVKHFLEKTKLLRELSYYTERSDLRQVFTDEIRAIKTYLRGEITRPELDFRRNVTIERIKRVILGIKDKQRFLKALNRSKNDIVILGDTVYMMAKARTFIVAAGI